MTEKRKWNEVSEGMGVGALQPESFCLEGKAKS